MTHTPVLLQEAVEALQVRSGLWYIDATFGRGGHTQEILNKGGQVIAFDCDEEAIKFGQDKYSDKVVFVWENFEKINEVVRNMQTQQPNMEIRGAIFDFGMSSPQVEDQARGFSFQYPEAVLDMRMDNRLGVMAKDLLAVLSEKQLAELFYNEGGEAEARGVARAIAKVRKNYQIQTVGQLCEVVIQAKHVHRTHLHPATKVFQALRIAVNRELDTITPAVSGALGCLSVGGRIVTISFHEGEDRIVKRLFREWQKDAKGHNIGDLVTPSEDESRSNPRSRSAKMRIFEKDVV